MGGRIYRCGLRVWCMAGVLWAAVSEVEVFVKKRIG